MPSSSPFPGHAERVARQRVARQRDHYYQVNRLVGVGELEPDVFAGSAEEWLLCARRWAKAAGLPDVQQGESLNDFERRVYGATCKAEGSEFVMPLLSVRSGEFDDRYETLQDKHVNSRGHRLFLSEHDAPIDVSSLPSIHTQPEPVRSASLSTEKETEIRE